MSLRSGEVSLFLRQDVAESPCRRRYMGDLCILKRERYYGKRFTSRQELVQMIHDYIYYYNNQRAQRDKVQ